jgi:hypothetical protein
MQRGLQVASGLLVLCLSYSSTKAGSPPLLPDGSIDIAQLVPGVQPSSLSSNVTTTFFDGTFNLADWTPGPTIGVVNAGNVSTSNQQVLSGGNPGAFWQFTTSINETGTSTYHRTFFNNASIFTPSALGAITSMSGGFSMNLLSLTSVRDVFDTELVIQQNGSVYLPGIGYGLQDVSPGWYGNSTLFGPGSSVPIQSSSNWTLRTGSGPTHPDFSITGSAIQFGVLTGSYFDSGAGSNVGGVDNWTFNVVYQPLPEPSSIMLLMVCALMNSRSRGRQRVPHFSS